MDEDICSPRRRLNEETEFRDIRQIRERKRESGANHGVLATSRIQSGLEIRARVVRVSRLSYDVLGNLNLAEFLPELAMSSEQHLRGL